VIDQCAQQASGDGTGVSSLEPVARYVNFLRALANADGTPKEVQVAAIVSLKDGTREPGVCTDGACQARCDQPAEQQACQNRCAGARPFALCMADCTAACKTFCDGQCRGVATSRWPLRSRAWQRACAATTPAARWAGWPR